MKTWKYIIVLDIKGKHNFKLVYSIHIAEIHASKVANFYKISKIGNISIDS